MKLLFVWCLLSCSACVQREAERGWFNLTAQEIQPLYYHTELEGQGWLRSRGCPEDAWNGGCSLLLDGLIPASHTAPVCAKCVFSVHPCLIIKSEGSSNISSLRLEGLLWALFRSSSWLRAWTTDLVLFVCSVSVRIFSLNVPLASKTLVTLIYKSSPGITVSLELKTTDASLCTHINARDVNREFLTIHPLLTAAYPLQGCCRGLEQIQAWVLLLLLHVR